MIIKLLRFFLNLGCSALSKLPLQWSSSLPLTFCWVDEMEEEVLLYVVKFYLFIKERGRMI